MNTRMEPSARSLRVLLSRRHVLQGAPNKCECLFRPQTFKFQISKDANDNFRLNLSDPGINSSSSTGVRYRPLEWYQVHLELPGPTIQPVAHRLPSSKVEEDRLPPTRTNPSLSHSLTPLSLHLVTDDSYRLLRLI